VADRPPVNRPLIAVAAALATIVVGMGGWQLTHMGGSGAADPARSSASPTPSKPDKLEIVRAQGFDPTVPAHPDTTARSTGAYAVDDDSSSAWRTQTYASPDFGRYKKGLGVLVDMGHPVKLNDVKATLPGGSGGGTLELRIGSEPGFDSLKLAARAPQASGTVELQPAQPVMGRYVLLWFTKLPASLKAEISDVHVFGWKG
jgi:hypothetical protein